MQKKLPKLPYGEGNMGYVPGRKGLIRYQKRINHRRVVTYGTTVSECQSKMRLRQGQLESAQKLIHPTDTDAAAPLSECVRTWLFTFKKPVLKGRSFDTMESTYENQIKNSVIGSTSIQYVATEQVQAYLNRLSEEKSASTARKTYSLLKQFFEHYYARDVNNNPMNLVILPKRQVRFTDMSQITDFEGKGLRIYKAYEKERVRDEVSEKKYKWVLTTPKTKKGKRLLYMHDNAMKHLKEHIRLRCPDPSGETFIFFSKNNNPMSDQYLNKVLKKALKRAGINKDISLHGLRHTGISYFLRHGVALEVISRQAGHNNISTTNSIYYNVLEEQKKDMYKNLH